MVCLVSFIGTERSFPGAVTAKSEFWPFASSYIKIVPRFRTASGLHSDSPLAVVDSVSRSYLTVVRFLTVYQHPSLWRHASQSPHKPLIRIKPSEPVATYSTLDSSAVSRTTIRLRTKHPVDISLTPLLVLVVDNLVAAETNSVSSARLSSV